MRIFSLFMLQAQRLIQKVLREDPDFPARGTLPLPVRMFALIPLEHSESRENQQLMIENMSVATVRCLWHCRFPAKSRTDTVPSRTRLSTTRMQCTVQIAGTKGDDVFCVGAPEGSDTLWTLSSSQ